MNINVKRVKIFVTIPVGKTDEIRKAICKAGAGQIGSNYEECSYKVVGTGTFRPINDANPFIGSKDNLEFVEEDKLEVICDIDKVKKVVETLRNVHPYEEPAIDIIPLLDEESFYKKDDNMKNNLSEEEIINYLCEGVNPITGEQLDNNHLINNAIIKNFLISIRNKNYKYSSNYTKKELSKSQMDLFNVLREWRMQKKDEENFFSAYMVFNDQELINIITADLNKKEDLLKIKGIGEVKYEKYSDELYDILTSFSAKNNDINEKVDNKIIYEEKGDVTVTPNTSVVIQNVNTKASEKFNIVELNYHYEVRFGNGAIGTGSHYKTIKVYDSELGDDEISSESEFAKTIEGHKVGYRFMYHNQLLEIISIENYK